MPISKALIEIQNELKAPKNQRNNFGNYNYRSAEDILEAVKPLLKQHNAQLVLSDTVEQVGDRIYIKATATFIDSEGAEIQNSAYAREAAVKKGMDESQITGTASSYSRKYALNGLFLIDDTKDADTDEYKKQTAPAKRAEGPDFNEIKAKLKELDNNFKVNSYAKEVAGKWPNLGAKQQQILGQIFADRRAEINTR